MSASPEGSGLRASLGGTIACSRERTMGPGLSARGDVSPKMVRTCGGDHASVGGLEVFFRDLMSRRTTDHGASFRQGCSGGHVVAAPRGSWHDRPHPGATVQLTCAIADIAVRIEQAY